MKVNDQMLADGKNQIKHAFGNYCDIHEKKKKQWRIGVFDWELKMMR